MPVFSKRTLFAELNYSFLQHITAFRERTNNKKNKKISGREAIGQGTVNSLCMCGSSQFSTLFVLAELGKKNLLLVNFQCAQLMNNTYLEIQKVKLTYRMVHTNCMRKLLRSLIAY